MGLVTLTRGNFPFQNTEEALDIIKTNASEKDDIWVNADEKNPCIAVCTNGEYAAITFFENEDGDMWLSFNEDNQVEVVFFLPVGEEWLPGPDVVISKDQAMECITEFLETNKRPESIKRQAL